MTEAATSQSAQPTALAVHLGSTAKPLLLAPHRGVLTLRELDAPEKEIEAFVSSAAVHDLGWRSLAAVRGEDRFRWLSGMVTNMVNDLAANAGAWNLVLNAQGQIQGELTVWRENDNLELELDADQREKLLAHLDHFIVMDDVELAPVEGLTALGLTGPLAAEVLGRSGLPALPEPMTSIRTDWNGFNLRIRREYGTVVPHYELWIESAGLKRLWLTLSTAGATPAGSAALEAFRIAEGIPAYGVDIVERDLPQETSQMRALHFTKGCYLGQEIVERIRSRGNVHRHLLHLELSGPAPAAGTELKLDAAGSKPAVEANAPAGEIRSAAELHLPSGRRSFALAMIRADAEIRSQTFHYAHEGADATALILSAPPELGLQRD